MYRLNYYKNKCKLYKTRPKYNISGGTSGGSAGGHASDRDGDLLNTHRLTLDIIQRTLL